MLASKPTGVAVRWEKWYQCMDVHWQLEDSHHIQRLNVVPLDSCVVFDPWSAVLQPQVTPYSGLQYFSILSLTESIFRINIFCHKMCFDFIYNNSPKHLYYKKRTRINKKIRMPSCQRAVFLSDLLEKWFFLTCSKNIQVPSFMKFRPCVRTDRQTWRS